MTRMTRWALLLAGCAVLATWPLAAGAQTKEKVFRSISPDQVGTILTDLNIKFTKKQPKDLPKDVDFEFSRNNFEIRLTVRDGKMLWISAYFPKATLEKINAWNVNVKFSRAVIVQIDNKSYSVVEAQLDVSGGSTENMVKQFIRRFDEEVTNFDRYLQ
jgi:hypothetical protein